MGNIKLILQSVDEEARLCRERWAAYPECTMAHSCHHNMHFELLAAPFEERIQFILTEKPEAQRASRLHHFGPLPFGPLPLPVGLLAAWVAANTANTEASPEFRELHDRLYPDCTWNGKRIAYA